MPISKSLILAIAFALITLTLHAETFPKKYPDVQDLTLEEKVGQLLMVHFNGMIANDDANILIQQAHAGAFIYYNWANTLKSPIQVQKLSNSLQRIAQKCRRAIPLIIAVDQEGGVVSRLNTGFTQFPGNYALAVTKKPELAEACSFACGEELSVVGINMNLAPVVDVNSNPLNPLIGIRAFSSDPEEVARLGLLTLQGYRKANIIATLKHFPGHGDVSIDSHIGLPVVNKSVEDLKKIELLPFTRLVNTADAIMTAHILMPSLDNKYCATLSHLILEGLLRQQMHYKGVIIADSLIMEGLLKNAGNIDDAAIMAINAGCDMLILGGKLLNGEKSGFELNLNDVLRIHKKIADAVQSKKISMERLNEAVQRILELKRRYNLSFDVFPRSTEIADHVNTQNHQNLANKIAELSVTMASNKLFLPINFTNFEIGIIGPDIISSNISQTSWVQLGKSNKTLFFQSLNPSDAEKAEAHQLAANTDMLVFFTYNAWRNEGQLRLVEALSQSTKPLIVIAVRDPQDAAKAKNASTVITTFGPAPCSLEAALKLLK